MIFLSGWFFLKPTFSPRPRICVMSKATLPLTAHSQRVPQTQATRPCGNAAGSRPEVPRSGFRLFNGLDALRSGVLRLRPALALPVRFHLCNEGPVSEIEDRGRLDRRLSGLPFRFNTED